MSELSQTTNPAGTQANIPPVRRVGTVTFGLVLVASGLCMLWYLFFPQWDYRLLLKLSPAILVSLGIETLVAARPGAKVRYDWVGMFLCFLIVCCALVLFVTAWILLHYPEVLPW